MEDNQLVQRKKARHTLSYNRRCFGLTPKEERAVNLNQLHWFQVQEDLSSTYEDIILLLHETDDHEDDSSVHCPLKMRYKWCVRG